MRLVSSKIARFPHSSLSGLLLALSLLLYGFFPSPLRASAGGEAFNPSSGTLNVNYAGYLSKEDVVYASPVTIPVEGLMVGNGRIGMMMWSQNGLTMQISGVDDSEQGAYSEGLINLVTSPGMDTGYSNFLERLSLFNGTLTTSYDSNRTVTIMGEPNSEVMGINVADTRSGVSAVTLTLSLWNISSLNNWSIPNLATWETSTAFANATSAGFSRGQADPGNFGYTLAASVDGTPYTTQVLNSGEVQLNITPASNYTIWIACASRLNAPSNNSVSQAQSLLSAVAGTYSSTLASYEAWWNAFWEKSFVEFSNSTAYADYVENLYYLATYMVAAGGYGNYPFHFINGVFRATGDNTKWSNAYWYWNQRDVYNSFFASNHPEMMNTFNNLYARNASILQTQTQGRYSLSGTWVPETMGWNGSDSGTVGSQYTENIYSTGTEAAENMYREYEYTNNYAYLTSTAYPLMKQVCIFYQNILGTNGSGQFYIPSTVDGSFADNAHETYWGVQDAITDLTAIRSLFPEAIAAAQLQGVDATFITQWQNTLNNLVPYPVDPGNAGQYYPCDPPLPAASNDENITSELAWPYGVVGLASSDLSFGISNWINRPFPYNNVWSPDAIQAARLGLGDDSFQGMQVMMEIYQNYPNGMTNNSNGVFEYLGVNLSALNESYLQSYNGTIRVFPAPFSDTSMVNKFTLAAQGGFLVSSENEAGELKYIGVKSLYGNTCSVYNPWAGQSLDVRNESNNSVILSTSNSSFSFPTSSNGIYVIEPSAKPFSDYSYEQITASQNEAAKTMGGNTLGTFAGAPPPPSNGLYIAQDANLSGTAGLSEDQAATGLYEIVDMGPNASASFNNVEAGCGLVIQYCTESNPGKLDLYINGALSQAVTFPTTNTWSGTYAQVRVSVNIPAAATVKLQYDNGDAGTNINYIQVLSCGTVTPTPTATPSPTPQIQSVWRINAGGNAYTDSLGELWAADEDFNAGSASLTTSAVSGCLPGASDQTLYQTTHWDANFSYTLAVPPGNYQVTLKFCENYWTKPGQRIQNDSINGSAVLSNFDIVATAGGPDIAVDKIFNNVAPSGGFITLNLAGASGSPDGNALVSAIQVIPEPATPTMSLTSTRSPSFSATPSPSFSPTTTVTGGAPVRVACVGASITFGYCSSNPATASYPAVLQNLLGSGYEVQNDGYSGAGMLKLGQEPYWGSTQMANALAFNPNIVIIDLGANDTKPIDWQYNASFVADYDSMVAQFRALPSHPTIYMALPCWVQTADYGITENIVSEYLLPRMIQIAGQQNLCMIDMFDALYNQTQYYCSDGVHLNDSGYAYMAQVMYNAITQSTPCWQAGASTPTPSPTVTLEPSASTWRINAGGSTYSDPSGNLWSADENFVGGASQSSAASIAGTTNPKIYQSERQGDVVTYAFPVPAWDYQVTLKFAEIDGNSAGQRQQNVYINGNQVLTNFDCDAQVGANSADDQVYDYIAPNALGQIFVQFGVPTSGTSQVCGIQILPESATPTITPSFSWTPTATLSPTPPSCPDSDPFSGSTLASFWSTANVGGSTGSGQVEAGSLSVSTSSGDIGGNADSFYYVFQGSDQNVDVRLKVNFTGAYWNAKSGLMLRDNTGGGAADFYIAATYSCCNYETGYRSFVGGIDNAIGSGSYASGANPGYLRVTRNGNLFTAYYSSDGVTWTESESETVAMGSNYLIGICTSTGNGSVETANYSNFSLTCSGPLPSSTATPNPNSSATASPSPSPSASPSASPSPTRTPSATPSWTATNSPSATPSPSPTASPSPTLTLSPTPSRSVTPSQTPTLTPSPSASTTPTRSPSASPSLSPSLTPSPTASPSLTPSVDPSPSLSPSESPTLSPNPSASPSPTASLTLTAPPTLSPSPSHSPSPTVSETLSPSNSPSFSATATPSASLTPSSSRSPSLTVSETLSPSHSASASLTPSPSFSETATRSFSPTPSRSPSVSATPSPSLTPSPSFSPSPSPLADLSASPSPNPLPTLTPTGAPGNSSGNNPTSVPQGPPSISKAFPLPNPNPNSIAYDLSGPADSLELKLYSRAMVCFWEWRGAAGNLGWNEVPLGPAPLANMANGLYFATLTPWQGGSPGKTVIVTLMLLR